MEAIPETFLIIKNKNAELYDSLVKGEKQELQSLLKTAKPSKFKKDKNYYYLETGFYEIGVHLECFANGICFFHSSCDIGSNFSDASVSGFGVYVVDYYGMNMSFIEYSKDEKNGKISPTTHHLKLEKEWFFDWYTITEGAPFIIKRVMLRAS